MKRFIPPLLALLFGGVATFFGGIATAETKNVAKNLRELKSLADSRAVGSKFDIEATVTIRARRFGESMVLQDGEFAVRVWFHAPLQPDQVKAGDRVRVSGDLKHNNLENISIDCTELRILDHDRPPEILSVDAKELLCNDFNQRLVRIEGTITDACQDEIDIQWTHMVLESKGTTLYLAIREQVNASTIQRLVGSHVRVVGMSALNDGGSRLVKSTFYVDSLNAITVIETEQGQDPFNAEDFSTYTLPVHGASPGAARVGAIGEVLAVWDKSKVLLRTASGSLVKGELSQPTLPVCGNHIHLVGTPETDLYNVILSHAIWRNETSQRTTREEQVEDITPAQLQSEESGILRYNFSIHGKPVRLTGIVRGLPVSDQDRKLHVESDSHMVIVDLTSTPDALRDLELGSKIGITGICVMEAERMGFNRMFPHITGYRIVTRFPNDLCILARPPWWTTMKLLSVIGALLFVVIVFFAWNVALHKCAEKRGKELLKEQLARVESDLKVGERTRLSVELHDTLSQTITGACLEVNAAQEFMSSNLNTAKHHLELAAKTLKACRNELRNCLWDLRSHALEDPDLNTAIRRTLEPYVGENVSLSIRFNVPREKLPDSIAHALMRIVRELVLNAVRHGQAGSVAIAGCIENNRLLFSVRDDGCGFDPTAIPGSSAGHFGLQGIHERLQDLNGDMSIESTVGTGCKATVSIALAEQNQPR